MSLSLFSVGRSQFFDANGDPLASGLLYTYEPGTTTPKASYSDKDGATPHSNPIVLDSRGEAEIWLSGTYKFVLKDSVGVTIWTADNHLGIGHNIQTGCLTKNVAGSANVALTSAEQSNAVIEFTGALTGNINVTVGDDNKGYRWILKNSTTGSYRITFKTTSGTGVTVPRGAPCAAYSDAANIAYSGIPEFDSVADARLNTPVNGQKYKLQCHTTEGDGGHGDLRGVTGAAPGTYTDNGGTIIVPTGGDGSAAWLRDVVGPISPRWFGAVGDGATDDTVSIQAAITAAGATYRTAFTDARTYRISSSLIMSVTGAQLDLGSATLLLDDVTGLKDHITVGNGTSQINNCYVYNGIFTRNQVATAGAAVNFNYVGIGGLLGNFYIYGNSKIYNGVKVYQGIQIGVIDGHIQGTVGDGVYAIGTAGVTCFDTTVSRCRIDNIGGNGVAFGNYTQGVFVRDNVIYSCGLNGVSLNGSAAGAATQYSFMIQSNDIDSCTGGAVYAQNASKIKITGNWLSAGATNSSNINLQSSVDDALIDANDAYSSSLTKPNFDLYSVATRATNNIVSGGQHGLVAESGSKLTIAGNTFENATGYGVYLAANPSYARLIGNTFGTATDGNANGSGAITDAVSPNTRYFANNPGYNPVGAYYGGAWGASPWTYTAGSSPEIISLIGGAVSNVAIGGTTIQTATNCTFALGPQQSAIITYTVAGTLSKMIQ